MPDETQAASSPAATDPVAPEATLPESATPEPQGESAPPEQASESDQDESVSAPEAAKPPEEGSKAERRIRQLTAQVRQLQRQMQSGPQQQQPQMMQPPQKPQLEQFDTIESYDKAVDQWREADRQFAIQQDRIARQQEESQRAQQKQFQDLRKTWDQRASRIIRDNPDFNVVEALGRVEPSPTMDGFFVDSEVGPELLDFLDTNPDEADRIRDLSPYAAMRELIKLEDRLSLQVKGIKAKPTLVQPPSATRGRASAPVAPKTAADVLYG